ncbi:hypothetical protein N7475_000528 [Penicillium sp. IBT 31633x]|nr:hypothetical protein N7475_000528 [Penicillium sp. IBT 31633x]
MFYAEYGSALSSPIVPFAARRCLTRPNRQHCMPDSLTTRNMPRSPNNATEEKPCDTPPSLNFAARHDIAGMPAYCFAANMAAPNLIFDKANIGQHDNK